MIPYVGVISRQDAVLLKALAERSSRILEYGAGASTQVFAAYAKGAVQSVEDDPLWLERAIRNLEALGLSDRVSFNSPTAGRYDLIFVDGPDEQRRHCALRNWKFLAVGGVMCFHDTRRTKPHGESAYTDVQNVCAVIERYSTEIASVVLNQDDSNITVVTKRAPLLYEDWMQTEGRTLAQMGLA